MTFVNATNESAQYRFSSSASFYVAISCRLTSSCWI